MKIGYKGTNDLMQCRKFQYELNTLYAIENGKVESFDTPIHFKIEATPKENQRLRLCSDEVIHYCDNLEDCFTWYPLRGGNRYFKVEIIGEYVDSDGKNGTTALRFIEEVDVQPILDKKKDDREDRDLKLDKVRKLQNTFPQLVIGGSLSLYLQGAKLKRIKENGVGDLDIIHPYWIDMTEADGVTHIDAKNSGNTFDETYQIDGVKIDLSVDNMSKYRIIEYKGHKYKVNTAEEILSYKAKYAMQKNGEKHKNDINELLGIK